jgi:hypothetical protein
LANKDRGIASNLRNLLRRGAIPVNGEHIGAFGKPPGRAGNGWLNLLEAALLSDSAASDAGRLNEKRSATRPWQSLLRCGKLCAELFTCFSFSEEVSMKSFTGYGHHHLGLAIIATALLAILGIAPGHVAGAADPVNLLAGGDLSRHWTTTGNWKLGDDGAVSLQPRPGEKGWTRFDAYLWSKQQYKDFEADFEYKVEKGGNSGFYFHVGDLKSPVQKGIEVQIYDSGSKEAGAKLTDHDSGGIIPGLPPTKNAAKPAGEWNRMKVSVQGNKVTVVLNGETVNEVALDDPKLKDRPATGWIGFQDHGLPLALRNVRVRSL